MSRQIRSDKLKSSPLAQRLVRALRKAGLDLPHSDDCYALQGCAPGHNQKSAGAWAWQLFVKDRQEWRALSLGSADAASTLRKNSKVEWYDARHDIEVCITTPKATNKKTDRAR